ncbi:MAG: hydrogenase maturation nickel metallochaperone HypA, partial [Deltaproteobacteria bacterium]|nr:hydrogenase maturation nickel metallochaperone HypA [Deltaproteobacteria bacterium]
RPKPWGSSPPSHCARRCRVLWRQWWQSLTGWAWCFAEGEVSRDGAERQNKSMHELSIAHEIVETVRRYLPTGETKPVKRVSLRVGALNRLTPDSLRFCFEAASRGTVVEGAKLDIEETSGDEIRVVEFDLDDRSFP